MDLGKDFFVLLLPRERPEGYMSPGVGYMLDTKGDYPTFELFLVLGRSSDSVEYRLLKDDSQTGTLSLKDSGILSEGEFRWMIDVLKTLTSRFVTYDELCALARNEHNVLALRVVLHLEACRAAAMDLGQTLDPTVFIQALRNTHRSRQQL